MSFHAIESVEQYDDEPYVDIEHFVDIFPYLNSMKFCLFKFYDDTNSFLDTFSAF